MDSLRVAVLQMVSRDDLDHNLAQAEALLRQAAAEGAELALLPEYFYLMPVDERARVALAAPLAITPAGLGTGAGPGARRLDPGRHIAACQPRARQDAQQQPAHRPARAARKPLRQAAPVWLLHRAGRQYDEGRDHDPGPGGGEPSLPWGVLRLGICHDLRFLELFRLGPTPDFIALPMAFTHTTGLAHWALLLAGPGGGKPGLRVCQCPGGTPPGGRRTFGHSMIIDPRGRILAQVEEGQAWPSPPWIWQHSARCAASCRPSPIAR